MAEDPLKELMDKIKKQRDPVKHSGAELMSLEQGGHIEETTLDIEDLTSLSEIDPDAPTLANSTLASLTQPKRGIKCYDLDYKGGKYAESARINTQINISKAQKFMVSNDLMPDIVEASFKEPKRLLDMLFRAVPCFDNMWIEWNELARTHARKKCFDEWLKRRGVDQKYEVAKGGNPTHKVGYHIMRVNDHFLFTKHATAWMGDHVSIYPIGFYLSNEGTFDQPVAESTTPELNYMTDLTQMRSSQILSCTEMLAPWYVEQHGTNKEQARYLEEIFNRTAVAQTNSMAMLVHKDRWEMGWDIREMAHMESTCLRRMTGDLRFLIPLLSILNYDLVVFENKVPKKKIDHIKFGKKVPKNEYKLIDVQLPKPRGKNVYEQMFTGQGSPKRQHEVRGHWRAVERDRFGNVVKRTWIPPHTRGNADLGVIIHDYNLKKKRG